jgi:hypothetical protein
MAAKEPYGSDFPNALIENNFTYHPPIGNQQQRYVELREKAKELAYLIEALCPDSREKSLALTNLEQSVMWANASIARNENRAE